MSRRNSYDALNRLSATYSQAGGIQQQWNYSYDMANQRYHVISDKYSWDYTYDMQGQLRTASKLWQDDVSQNYSYVAGQQFQYDHDQIGNRTAAWRGGRSDGTGLRQAMYGADRSNQYTSRTAPGIIDVLGMAHKGVKPGKRKAG